MIALKSIAALNPERAAELLVALGHTQGQARFFVAGVRAMAVRKACRNRLKSINREFGANK